MFCYKNVLKVLKKNKKKTIIVILLNSIRIYIKGTTEEVASSDRTITICR